jgi:hypothetical protein
MGSLGQTKHKCVVYGYLTHSLLCLFGICGRTSDRLRLMLVNKEEVVRKEPPPLGYLRLLT